MTIEDIDGRSVTAMKVFGTSIRALRNHLFLTFTERGVEIEPNANIILFYIIIIKKLKITSFVKWT
jgi:hypothetical protein